MPYVMTTRYITEKMNVCLFGLSGDPPTGRSGHMGIVNAVTEMNFFDEIWIIPVYRHMYVVRIMKKRIYIEATTLGIYVW
jgi:nicotinic acid mononucleotide adenylyltransferase